MTLVNRGALAFAAVLISSAGCALAKEVEQDQEEVVEEETGEDGKVEDDELDEVEGCPFSTPQPLKKALFTLTFGVEDLTIETEFRRLVRSAVPGSEIRISMYAFSRQLIADELIDAGKNRGVDVKVVVDGFNRVESPAGSGTYVPFAPLQDIREALGNAAVVICSEDEAVEPLKGGCLSSGINHNKFALFSELCDGSRDVVFQSSANFASGQNNVNNNAVIIREDPALYAGYLQLWTDEAAQLSIPNYYRQIDGQNTRAFFFPRPRTGTALREPSTDTMQGVFENVTCTGGTRVRVAMTYWNDSRDYLVDTLRGLRDAGCDVRIVSNLDTTSDAIKTRLANAFSTDHARLMPYIHHKYVLVDGIYSGAPHKYVWTGTHDFVFGAIRSNEETILRVDDIDVFNTFDANWEGMWAKSSP